MPPKFTAILKQPWILAVISGLLMTASFPPLDLGLLAFFALMPLLFALREQTPRKAFRLGFLAGFVFFATTFEWMTIFAYSKSGIFGAFTGLLLAAILALFIGVWALGSSIVINSKHIPDWSKPAAIASLMVLLDYVRQLGTVGIGLGELGYTQWRDPILMDTAPLLGIWGMTWLVTAANSLASFRNSKIPAYYVAFALALSLIGNTSRTWIHPSGHPYVAAALQANIDQDVPWSGGRPQDPAYFDMTINTFADLTTQASAKGAKLCVTAETSMPGYFDLDNDLANRISTIARANNVAILAGGREFDQVMHEDKNVLALFTGNPNNGLQSVQSSSKQQLVPFGEFVPMQNMLGNIPALRLANFNMEAGGLNQPPIDAGPNLGKLGVVVCYDMTYPRCVRYQLRSDAGILAVGSDDTWFGRTSESRQSEAVNAVRAAESDRYLVRASATGISAIFDNHGKVVADLPLFTRGVITNEVQPMTGETLFVRFGDWWVGICAIVLAAVCTLSRHKSAN